MNQPIETLCRELNYLFVDKSLLEKALTHRSIGADNNERLEFLGDSILGFVIASELFKYFPKAKEGELSRYRASLVKGDTLAILASELDLGRYLRLGPGELKSGGFRRDSILANAFEAIIGALYLDGGLHVAEKFILETYIKRIEAISERSSYKDPKTRLQEYLQARRLPLPEYSVVEIAGKSHEQLFKVTCKISLLVDLIEGDGSNRRKAEQDAAEKVLQHIKNDK
ncbi:MAG: ribonuclease III [Gammaproteobacteria bacterium]|nr:ribonuclease III [Gammaproteobacteria bacterium]